MIDTKIRALKRAQKEALIRKEFSKLFLNIKLEDPELQDLYINRVKLSSDKSVAHIFFYIDGGQDVFNEKLKKLILYKPSLRKALSQLMESRYTPQIVFKYDKAFEKQYEVEKLLDKVKETLPPESTDQDDRGEETE